MQVGNDKDYIRQIYRTLAPLNCMLSFIGLGCNLSDRKRTNFCWTNIKNVLRVLILAIIDFYTLFYKVAYLSDAISPSIKYTDYVQMLYDFVQYIVDLYYIRKYSPVCFEYFKQYETIDRILVIMNYNTIAKKLIRLMCFFAILWILSSVCDFVAWGLNYGWLMASIYTLTYIFLLIKIFTTLDLTSQIMHIESRLQAVGDLLDTRCKETEACSPLFDRNKKKWLSTSDKGLEVVQPKTPSDSQVAYHEIKWLGRCYLLLTEQAEFVNKMYGTRILLNSLSLLIDMVRFTNIAARILIRSQNTKFSSGYIPVVSSVMRLLTCAAVLMSLVRHCEQVYRQRERILDIIYNLLIFKCPCESLKKDASELRDLIQARPLDLTMANFFRLDYSLLTTIASVVVTYTIILLQTIN